MRIIRINQDKGRYKWAKAKNKATPKMLPYVPGAIGNNPIPNPVARDKEGLEKISFNFIFKLFDDPLILI